MGGFIGWICKMIALWAGCDLGLNWPVVMVMMPVAKTVVKKT